MKTIRIYRNSDTTKKGMLKRKARAIYERLETEMTDHDLAKEIIGIGFKDFSIPYIFSKIDCSHPLHGYCYIVETVLIGSDRREVITSPRGLLEALN